MSPWIPAIISGATFLVGIGLNILQAGRSSGRFESAIKAQSDKFDEHRNQTAEALAKLEKRADDIEDEVAREAQARVEIEGRVRDTEKAAEAFWGIRDLILKMQAAGEERDKYQREKVDSLVRSVSVIERQMGTLASKGLEFKSS